MVFCTESNTTNLQADEVLSSTLSEFQKSGGVAFSIEYKSTVPKLPPINAKRVQLNSALTAGDENWKEERDKLLVDKHEKAKIRRERIIQQKSCLPRDQGQPGLEMSLKARLRKIEQTKTTI